MKQKSAKEKLRYGLLVAIAIATSVWLLGGCGGGGGPGPGPTISLMDGAGHAVREINQDTHPSIVSKLTGLPPNTPVEIMVYKDGQPLYPQPISTTTNDKGEISGLALLYDIGVDPTTGLETPATGSYDILVIGPNFKQTFSFTVKKERGKRQFSWPVVWTKLSNLRFACGYVPEGDAVYAQGYAFPPNTKVRIYVVKHPPGGLPNGALLNDVTEVIEEVTTDSSGFLPYTLIWNSAKPEADGNRNFDLVVDVNLNGRYDANVDAIDGGEIVGFTVQRGAPEPGERIDVVCDPYGNYKTSFTTNEELSFWVNPPSHRLLSNWPMVGKYICVHKETWNIGDPLIDVSGRPEWDIVRLACWNENFHTVWYPPLKPGYYDPVIDVDRDGKYSEYDILGKAFTVQGPTPTRIYVSATPPTIDPNERADIFAVVVDQNNNPIQGVNVNFSITDSGATLNPTSDTTNEKGIARTVLTAGPTGGITIVVKATATADSTQIEGEAKVVVRAYGGINAIIKGRRR